MQSLQSLREVFYFFQRFKHARPIVDQKFAREWCNVFAFYVK